ncbi:MAG TPA: DUF2891 domain-containing protein [Rhizomicrobium sp.]|nr:DUF2891 domain-containing protein [Rhizomicrobium sp.]
MTHELTPALASQFARIAQGHVTREYPNKLDHALAGPEDAKGPRALHPIFFGSFDWHSAVHGHWLLARLHRRFPEMPDAKALTTLLDSQFTKANVAGELAYLSRPNSGGFERPYGWAWLLMLAGELARHTTPEGRRWNENLRPLADAFAERFLRFLPLATYPVRAGVHSNTAFALLLTQDYARATGHDRLLKLCGEKARAWYGEDRDYRSLEPSQDEFLSPSLVEAACMRAFLEKDAFAPWLARFLPRLGDGEPAALFAPATVSDRTDGKIAHLDGLNLSRAWCWRLILDALPAALKAKAERAITGHLDSALPHIAGDYMGEHWLASFALLALDVEERD